MSIQERKCLGLLFIKQVKIEENTCTMKQPLTNISRGTVCVACTIVSNCQRFLP